MEEGKCSGFIWCKSMAYPLHYIMQGLSTSIVFLFAHVHTLQLLAVLVHLNAKNITVYVSSLGCRFF